jgi:hypothetical protein
MERTKTFLQENSASFGIYDDFSSYKAIFEAIDKKTTADNCIEACKSLIEGISKTVIFTVRDSSPILKESLDAAQIANIEQAKKQIKSNTISFPFAFKQACIILSSHQHSFEKQFFDNVGKTFCNVVGDIRNWRGDVSHGRVSPKLKKSSMSLAFMVESITDTLAFHMLESLSLIDFNQADKPSQETLIVESFIQKQSFEIEVISEEERVIREFNDSLDELYPLEGKPRYSRALYDQYQEDYQIQLQEFIDNREQDLTE